MSKAVVALGLKFFQWLLSSPAAPFRLMMALKAQSPRPPQITSPDNVPIRKVSGFVFLQKNFADSFNPTASQSHPEFPSLNSLHNQNDLLDIHACHPHEIMAGETSQGSGVSPQPSKISPPPYRAPGETSAQGGNGGSRPANAPPPPCQWRAQRKQAHSGLAPRRSGAGN